MLMPPVSVPCPLPVPPVGATIPRLLSDETVTPIKVVPKQRDTAIVKIRPEVSKPCSPDLETARKWSNPHVTPASGEGGQLARAATYIQDRLRRHSSTCNEFVPWMLKVPPDKKAELDTQQRILNVVREAEKARASSCLPESLTESTSLRHSQLEAVFPQLDSSRDHFSGSLGGYESLQISRAIEAISRAIEAIRRSDGHLPHEEELVEAMVKTAGSDEQSNRVAVRIQAKPPCEGGHEWQLIKVVSSSSIPSAEMCSPKTKIGLLPLVLRLGNAWASTSCCLGVEISWRAWCKMLNMVAPYRRYIHDVIIRMSMWSPAWHLPEMKMGLELILKPDQSRAASFRLLDGSLGHRMPISVCSVASNTTYKNMCLSKAWMVVIQSPFTLKEISQVKLLKQPDWTVLQRFLNGIVDEIEIRQRMSRSLSEFAWAHLLSPIPCRPQVNPWIVKTPSVGVIERCNKCSNVKERLAIKQVLPSSSAEVEEGRQAAVMLSITAPATLPVPPASAVPPQQHSDGQMSPVLSLSSELIGLCPKSSNDEGYKLRPLEVISFSNTLSAEWCSPESKTSALLPVYKPGTTQVFHSCLQSLEGWWLAHCKPPNAAAELN